MMSDVHKKVEFIIATKYLGQACAELDIGNPGQMTVGDGYLPIALTPAPLAPMRPQTTVAQWVAPATPAKSGTTGNGCPTFFAGKHSRTAITWHPAGPCLPFLLQSLMIASEVKSNFQSGHIFRALLNL